MVPAKKINFGICFKFRVLSVRPLMGADVLDLFLSASRLGRADFACSLHMMLVMEGARKENKGLDFFCLKNLVDLLKSLVATAYVDCTAYAPCKRLCV